MKRIRVIDVMVVLAIAALVGWWVWQRAPRTTIEPAAFAAQVELGPLHRTAVQADGRLRSFGSHAKTYMGYVSGPYHINGQSDGFNYLDLMLRPEKYADTDMIFVKIEQVRAQIIDVLDSHGAMNGAQAATPQPTGLFSRALLNRPEVRALLDRLGQDLIRSAKAVDAIQSALAVSEPRFLLENLRMVPPPNGDVGARWLALEDLVSARGIPQDGVHANVPTAASQSIPGLDPAKQRDLVETWSNLRTAWRAEDATAVNGNIAKLAELLPNVAPELYPAPRRLALESWYFRNQSMTWVWLFYLACLVPLLMSVVYRWNGAHSIGMIMFAWAFACHTASVGLRWYISGRWPNTNMFEALTTSAWFGGVAAMILERVARRTAFRNLFALGSAVISMAALMAAYFLPAQLDSSINNKTAALNDVWLYIHTNMVIASYAVIGLACVPAMLHLRQRWCLLWDAGLLSRVRLILLPIALAVANYTGYLLLMNLIDNSVRGLPFWSLLGVCGALWGSLMIVLLEGFAARTRRAAGIRMEHLEAGGATRLITATPAAHSFLREERPSAAQVFDGATMVLVQLAFVMLWTGIAMGAIWADHSWGRPWGWDPKEVFALNTFIIFLILIHVRLKVKDKGFWTAVLAVAGFEVMMFNWIVVNFVITGLHSYA